MRRAEYFIPAGILLKCFLEVGHCLPGCLVVVVGHRLHRVQPVRLQALSGSSQTPSMLCAQTSTASRLLPKLQRMMHPAVQVSDRELYDKIMAGAAPGSGHAAFVGERAELLLSQPARLGLRTR